MNKPKELSLWKVKYQETMKDIFSDRNSRQREAVESTEGRIRVVAGAGTGKTKALTHRYAYIVNVLGIDPANILCLTFTNKAAEEMRARISEMVQSGYYNDFVSTIHGFCVKFLRQEIYRLGFPKSFTVLDEEDFAAERAEYNQSPFKEGDTVSQPLQ